MIFDISAACRRGCVRMNNEDMVLIEDCFLRDSHLNTLMPMEGIDRYMLALADGMGGHQKGEVASSEVLHNLQFFFNDIPANLKPDVFNEMMVEWLESMNNIFDSKGRVDEQYRGMGTTLVALVFYNSTFYYMNCGDSRLYHLRGDDFRQLTTDHSLSNLMGWKEHSNIITNCIGGGCRNSYIDVVQCADKVQPGDTLLLCSDGLNDMVTDDTLKRMLHDGCDADALCMEAEQAGGLDNVSAVVVRVTQ